MLFQEQVLKTEKYKLDLLFSIQAVRTKKQKLWKHFYLHMQPFQKRIYIYFLKNEGDFQNDAIKEPL